MAEFLSFHSKKTGPEGIPLLNQWGRIKKNATDLLGESFISEHGEKEVKNALEACLLQNKNDWTKQLNENDPSVAETLEEKFATSLANKAREVLKNKKPTLN